MLDELSLGVAGRVGCFVTFRINIDEYCAEIKELKLKCGRPRSHV